VRFARKLQIFEGNLEKDNDLTERTKAKNVEDILGPAVNVNSSL
jgi:hypothetical protein